MTSGQHSLTGYVIYGKDNNKNLCPVGIVASDYKRKAIQNNTSSKLKNFLVAIEDKRFYDHQGFDLRGIMRALYMNVKSGHIVQGGSTITQQLARNLMFNNSRTVSRKINEIAYSIRLEMNYSKEEILELYFGNVYWGNNIYGLRAASLSFFGKEPYKLTENEQISLLTLLRGPNLYLAQQSEFEKRYKLLNQVLYERNIINNKHFQRNTSNIPNLEPHNLAIFREDSIPYLSESIDYNHFSIKSSLDHELQKFVNIYINESDKPCTILALRKGKVVALGSSYGKEHPFKFKTNVGSTLKPFLYTFLRRSGISDEERFISTNNNIGWPVREATYNIKDTLNLAEALLLSNNNTFINASDKVGLEKVTKYFATLLNKDVSQVYPSTILGATNDGISLYELTRLYHYLFSDTNDNYNQECCNILNQNAKRRLGVNESNVFLKTGTTNDNKERYVILGNEKLVVGILMTESPVTDHNKDGVGVLGRVAKFWKKMTKQTNDLYSWLG